MSTLTKAKLAKHLEEKIGSTHRENIEIIECFFEKIAEALMHGEQVRLSGYGNFALRDKKERPGLNPMTGAKASVSARRVVTFHSGKKLKLKIEKISTEKSLDK